MESRILRVLVSLGVPGVALGIFYLLFRTFKWKFPEVPSAWVGPIIVLFMVLVASVTFYALSLWRPTPARANPVNGISVSIPKNCTFKAAIHALAANDKRVVEFQGFTPGELRASVGAREISADTVTQAILQVRDLTNGAVRRYRVQQASSGGYVVMVE